MQDCPPRLIEFTTGHYSTGPNSTSLWLAFLASVQQGRALERRALVVLNSTSMCIATPTGNILEGSEIRMPLYIPHMQWGSVWCLH